MSHPDLPRRALEDLPVIEDVWPLPRDPQKPLLPPPLLDEFREHKVVRMKMYDGTPAALVLNYDDVREVMRSSDVSADSRRPGFPFFSEGSRINRGGRPTFDRLDPPEHDEHRGMLAHFFAVKRVRGMRPFFEGLVDRLMDEMAEAGPDADLVGQFANFVPAEMIAELLDIPRSDLPRFIELVEIWTDHKRQPDEIRGAAAEITAYFERLMEERRGGDGADIVTILVRDYVDTGLLSREQFLLTMNLMITGGFETTATTIALGTIALLEHDSWRELAEDAENELVAGAIEEILRYVATAHNASFRLTMDEVPLSDVTLPANHAVVASQMAANHDPAQYPEPHRLDIRRDARGHLAFGLGLHQCVAQSLARLALTVTFERLPKRFPELQMTKSSRDLEYFAAVVYGVRRLPVRLWT